jgi:ribosomal protein L29
MTRSPPPRPTKAELGEMSVAELDAYIRVLRRELEWAQGSRRKAVSKDLEVAEKVRELRRGREAAGDV